MTTRSITACCGDNSSGLEAHRIFRSHIINDLMSVFVNRMLCGNPSYSFTLGRGVLNWLECVMDEM